MSQDVEHEELGDKASQTPAGSSDGPAEAPSRRDALLLSALEANPPQKDHGGGGLWRFFLLLLAAFVAAFALLWQAGESHYRGCLESTVLRSGVTVGEGFVTPTSRTEQQLADCDRLPF